jgi:hypothetical protein
VDLDKLSAILGRPAAVEPLPVTLRYTPAHLRAEAAKAGLGAAICFGAIVFLSPAPIIAWPVAVAGLLFLLYLGQLWRRRALRLELTFDGIARTTGNADGADPTARLNWHVLQELHLHFYPHRRRSPHGTLVLTVRGDGMRVKLDSSVEHFPTLLLRAAGAARERALPLDRTSADNLAQLGL